MSIASDIINRSRADALRAAIAIMTASLTDAQISIVAAAFAGLTASEIRLSMMTVAPPEEHRTGILLPYCVEGHLEDYPTRIHDVAVLVLGLASLGTPKARGAIGTAMFSSLASDAAVAIKAAPGAIRTQPAPVGARVFYKDWPSTGPAALRASGETLTPSAVFNAVNLTPHGLGVGYSGSSPLKGTLASALDSQAAPGRAAGRQVADTDLDAASNAVTDLEDVE